MAQEPERISKIEGIGSKSLEQVEKVSREDLKPQELANKDHFESLMAQERTKESLQAQRAVESTSTNKPSLLDEVRELNNKIEGWRISIQPDDLIAQARDAKIKIEEIKGQLATPNLEIKPSVQNLLKRKLNHIDDSLKIALDKAGVDYNKISTAEGVTSNNPIERFLGLLTQGQKKLDGLADHLSILEPGKIKPGDLMAVQIKVNFVQQQLEFFTNMLTKSLESTKTLMNVQI